jgi:AcrR family transcriptional regulator
MRAIAKLSGITAGAIYSHFDDKAQLLMEVVKRTMDLLPLSANRITGEEDPEILAENAASHTDPASKLLRRLSLEVHTAAARDEKLKELLLDYDEMIIGKVQKIIERAQKKGSIDEKRDPEFTARALVVFVMGLNHLDTLYPQLLGDPSWRRFVVATATDLLGMKTA